MTKIIENLSEISSNYNAMFVDLGVVCTTGIILFLKPPTHLQITEKKGV